MAESKEKVSTRRLLTPENLFFGFGVTSFMAAVGIRATSSDQAALFVCKPLLVFACVCFSGYILQLEFSTSIVIRWILRLALVIFVFLGISWAWFTWGETPKIRASAKRRGLLEDIREEYIQHNNPVDKAIASGELPPAIYLNEQLAKRGETLRVTDTPPAPVVPTFVTPVPNTPPTSTKRGKRPPRPTPANPNSELTMVVPAASDRGYLAVAGILLHTELIGSQAAITVRNPTGVAVVGGAIVLAAIIVSPHLPNSEQENALFAQRAEWQSGGGIIPRDMPPGSIYKVNASSAPVSPDEYKKLELGKNVVYVVTEIWASDRLGVLPGSESCWYIQPPQWEQFHTCFGHNGIGEIRKTLRNHS